MESPDRHFRGQIQDFASHRHTAHKKWPAAENRAHGHRRRMPGRDRPFRCRSGCLCDLRCQVDPVSGRELLESARPSRTALNPPFSASPAKASPRRGRLADAPTEWFTLQRGWWRGTADTGTAIPPYIAKLAVNLTEDWAFKPREGLVTGAPPETASLADPKLDDASWPRRRIRSISLTDRITFLGSP